MYKKIEGMKEQLVVSMTGFVHDPQEESYKKAISELHIRLAPTLSEETTVLIVNDVTTEKYKVAGAPLRSPRPTTRPSPA